MKKMLMLTAIVVALTGCSSLTSKDVKDASDVTKTGLSIAQKACVMANAFLPRTELGKWCKIADPYLSALDDLLPAAAAAYQASHPKSALAGAAPPKRFVCEDAAGGATCSEAATQ